MNYWVTSPGDFVLSSHSHFYFSLQDDRKWALERSLEKRSAVPCGAGVGLSFQTRSTAATHVLNFKHSLLNVIRGIPLVDLTVDWDNSKTQNCNG